MRWIGLLGSCVLCSQPVDAPKPFYWGGTWGLGGVHLWARPALALRYGNTFFHFSPFPAYLSFGFSQPIGYFRVRERYDRPLYAAIHVHQRYWPSRELRGDSRILALLGVRVWLEPYLQRFFLQMGMGAQAHHARPQGWRLLPAAECHIGGFYRPSKYVPKRFRREGIEKW
ncbi:MAG: hypothetical protein N2170_07555 [Bacteroidia bacterium]|nr:hypothetical protein [Bacteroidia bacterium]